MSKEAPLVVHKPLDSLVLLYIAKGKQERIGHPSLSLSEFGIIRSDKALRDVGLSQHRLSI